MLKIYGAVLLVFVVGRLLLVDVWKMEIAGKIVTFFMIGALFFSQPLTVKKFFGIKLQALSLLKLQPRFPQRLWTAKFRAHGAATPQSGERFTPLVLPGSLTRQYTIFLCFDAQLRF